MSAARVISLGYRCEVAHRIRTRFGDDRAMPFDWLITPLSSIPLMVEDEFRQMSPRSGWSRSRSCAGAGPP